MSILDRHPAPFSKVDTGDCDWYVMDANSTVVFVADDAKDADFVVALAAELAAARAENERLRRKLQSQRPVMA